MPQSTSAGLENERLQAGPESSLEAIAQKLRDFREARGWQRFHTPKNLAMSVAVECGELLEHFQWVDDEALVAHLADREDEVSEELADVAIYVIQLADSLGVSLSRAIVDKIERNAERYPVELSRGIATKHSELHGRKSSGQESKAA